MNAKQAQQTRSAANSAIQESLRKLLLLELEALDSTPEPATADIRADIDSLNTARANPTNYDAMFAEHLSTLPDWQEAEQHPATLARIYNQWDRDHSSRLDELNRSLAEANAQTAQDRVRSILDHTLTAVLASSSLYGAAMTSPLELMNPAAADPRRPIILTGPDGLNIPVKHWYQILLAPLTALAERRAIRADACPVRLGGAKHPILQLSTEESASRPQNGSRSPRATRRFHPLDPPQRPPGLPHHRRDPEGSRPTS